MSEHNENGGRDNVRLHPIFTDHMVLQRGKPAAIWGTGTDGTSVRVTAGGVVAEATVTNGAWQVELEPGAADGEPFELHVSWEAGGLVLRDVVLGDVWLAGGQSNMEFRLDETADAAEQLPLADYPMIRYFDVPRMNVAGEEADALFAETRWLTCTPEQAGAFSGVAYHYARRVHEASGVPIGIIGCNWGGTSASCWIEERRLADGGLRVYVDEHAQAISGLTDEQHEQLELAYKREVEEAARAIEAGEDRAYPWPPPVTNRSFTRPNGLYRTMLRRVVPYALKGFIYYQGETDTKHPLLYDRLLAELIDNWRTDWSDHSLPFLFVQLPRYGNNNPDGEEYALLRESQQLVAERVAHTALAVVYDCGERDDIHPADKKPVGERLALVARKHVYGEELEWSGPVLDNWSVGDDGKVRVSFARTGEGLRAEGDELIGFELAGDDGSYVWAQAAISGSTVTLWSADVPKPRHVRYAWKNYCDANLSNSSGLPAAPFRTNRENR